MNVMNFNEKFDTYIIAYSLDYNLWFITNNRYFYYEYPIDFIYEKCAINYFKSNLKTFYDIELKMNPNRPKFLLNKICLNNDVYDINESSVI